MNRKIRKVISQIAFFVYNRIGAIFLRLNPAKVVFASEAQSDLKGNLKAVHDALPSKYEKAVHIKSDRRRRNSLSETFRLWKDLTTATYIFLDDFYGVLSAMKVRKDQEIIQLWHGSGAFKKFGFSRLKSGELKRAHKGYRKYTKATVTAEPIRWCYAEAFDIDVDKVRAIGNPRTDIFFDDAMKHEAKERVYSAYPILRDRKIVLIAPTYRGRTVEEAYYDFDQLGLGKLSEELGDEYVILTKWHPALVNNIKRGLCSYNKAGTLDVSDYQDINDLMVVSDILVTDYSSIVFEWYLTDKPIVYFAYDLEEYKGSRGLYFDFDEYVYGAVATDQGELIEALRKPEIADERRTDFGEKFMSACDGHATERIIEWVFGRE